jgi:hypothetical protein
MRFGKGEKPPTKEMPVVGAVLVVRDRDWNWPTRGHKVRPTGDRQPQARRWDRIGKRWVR